MEKAFIVICKHCVEGKFDADVVLLTDDLKTAIDTVGTVESLGYDFSIDGGFVAVVAIEPGYAYTKKDMELHFLSSASEKYPGVYHRSYFDGTWKNTWLNGDYGRKYDIERGIYQNSVGEFAVNTEVSFRVENQDQWVGDNDGVLIIDNGEFKIKTIRSGILTIDKGYDVYGNTIKPLLVEA